MLTRLRPSFQSSSRSFSTVCKLAVGAKLPAITLQEYRHFEGGEGCAIGPNPIDLQKAAKGKRVALFGLPGAFTPACSEKHLPGFLTHHKDFVAAGVDEIWCIAVNDAFVMGAWGENLKAQGKIRMIGDGDAVWTKATNLTFDLTGKGLGLRSTRYSMLVKDGVITHLNVDAPGKFEKSDAETLLAQAKAH
ncbi:peroxiredoxin [Thraustotheca clavata]|uniref:Peroxiredoxin n=1 Tax=Thraustotheca clavata TaxID=74557 RepID=A0A1V9ZQW7_9STRA|nr:peroxiredoxin [Thraustotheca clavata]